VELLLTSSGVTNPSIHAALVQLLGKPVAECHALVVPACAIDEQTAITVVDGCVEVVSEGRGKKFGS
jgi:hypothetical protein